VARSEIALILGTASTSVTSQSLVPEAIACECKDLALETEARNVGEGDVARCADMDSYFGDADAGAVRGGDVDDGYAADVPLCA
jgi:hypothetical protein